MTKPFPFLDLPTETQVDILSFLLPRDFYTCFFVNKHLAQLISSDWPWKRAFFRLFHHSIPFITCSTSWRVEYCRRIKSQRTISSGSVFSYKAPRISAITRVLPGPGNVLVLVDERNGTVLKIQMYNGRQTQLGRFTVHEYAGILDIDETRLAFAKPNGIQTLLHSGPSSHHRHSQIDLLTAPDLSLIQWIPRTTSSLVALAYQSSSISIANLSVSPPIVEILPHILSEPFTIKHMCASSEFVVVSTSLNNVSVLPLINPHARSWKLTELPCGIDQLVYNESTHPFVLVRTTDNARRIMNIVNGDGFQLISDNAQVSAWAWSLGFGTAGVKMVVVTSDLEGVLRIYTYDRALNHVRSLDTQPPITALLVDSYTLTCACAAGVLIYDYNRGQVLRHIMIKNNHNDRIDSLISWYPDMAEFGQVAMIYHSGRFKILQSKSSQRLNRSVSVKVQAPVKRFSGTSKSISQYEIHSEINEQLIAHHEQVDHHQSLADLALHVNGLDGMSETDLVQLAMLISEDSHANQFGPETLGVSYSQYSEEEALVLALEQSLIDQ